MSKAQIRYGRFAQEIVDFVSDREARCTFVLPDGFLICGRRYDIHTEDGRQFSTRLDGMIFTRHGTHCSGTCEANTDYRAFPAAADKPLVMIVEDDEDVMIAMREVLEREGVNVECAPHGRAALALLRSSGKAPSLLLLDLMMPVMDGWQFREAQKRDELLRDIPTIAISANASPRRPIDVELLPKPFDLDTLIGKVHQHCRWAA